MSSPLIRCCSSSCPFASGECSAGADPCCEAKVQLESALHKYFAFVTFLPGQLDALLPVLHGRDVLVRMATGAGKSLCIFLAPLAMSESALGIVISPLNGLMDQQVRNEARGHSYQIARRNATLVGWLFLSSGKNGNLVLAVILAFYAVKTASLSLPRPSRYLKFSSAHGRCTTGVLLVDVGARSPLTACTFK